MATAPPDPTPPADPHDPHDEASPEQVQRALDQVGPHRNQNRPRIATRHLLRIVAYACLLLAASAVLYAIRFDAIPVANRIAPLAQRLARGGMLIATVLLVGAFVNGYFVERFDDHATRYNVRRIVRFVQGIAIAFVLLSILFVNWYTAAVSLGLASAILGFALQTPISSFIGWVYILVKAPYQVGDRIEIGGATGDVIDVGYLDTTLWEFGGPYVSTDQPSGRLIRFPNANVLSQAVYNYSWPLFPYIWNEVYVQIAYGSDLEWVATTMRRVADEELGDRMAERVPRYCELLAKTAVDELHVQPHPVVVFRVSQNTWVEAVVRYLVSPRRAGPVKARLTTRLLTELNAKPDHVMFPKGDNR
jgi:small-conductance mechanosensitive channel